MCWVNTSVDVQMFTDKGGYQLDVLSLDVRTCQDVLIYAHARITRI